MLDPEWRLIAEDDGYGGTRYYRIRLPGPINPNVLWYPVGLYVLCGIVGALFKVFGFLSDHSGFIFYIIVPALMLPGLIQYPLVRIADKIRRVRYPDHRFLRRWFIVSCLLLPLEIGPILNDVFWFRLLSSGHFH